MSKIKRTLQLWGLGVVIGNGIVLTLLGGLLAVKMFIDEGSVFSFFIMIISLWSSVAVVAIAPKLDKHFKTIRAFLMWN